jgi:hypothetical protein
LKTAANKSYIHLFRVKFLAVCVISLLMAFSLAAQNPGAASEAESEGGTEMLLAGYLSRDSALVEQAIALEEARLNAGKTRLEQGFNIQLSTGTMYMRYHPESSSFEFSPSASASFPELIGTTVDVSTTVKADSIDTRFENTKLSLSTDIISSQGKQREVDILKAERSVLEAERALISQGLKSEKAFYGELQSMYDAMTQLFTKRDTQYTKELELAAVVAQGYGASSARYRTAELEAKSARHAAEEAERSLTRSIDEFSRKCGITVTSGELRALGFSVPEIPDFSSYAKESFTGIESAAWNHAIGEKSRAAQGDFSLSGSLGTTIANTDFTTGTSVDAGLQLSWRGLGASVGASFPLSPDEYPLIQATLKINPLDFKTRALEQRAQELSAQKELLALKKADESYDDTSHERAQTLSDILWRENERVIQAELYTELASDMETWFNRGVITETEYRQAVTNKQKAQIALKLTEVEKIIYRIDTEITFTETK